MYRYKIFNNHLKVDTVVVIIIDYDWWKWHY